MKRPQTNSARARGLVPAKPGDGFGLSFSYLLACALLATAVMSPARADNDWLSPNGALVSPDGKALYLTLATANQLATFDLASGKIAKTTPLPSTPTGLALSKDGGRLYVTCAGPVSQICEIDLAKCEIVAQMAAGHTAGAPVISPDGQKLFIVERFDGRVAIFDLAKHERAGQVAVDREPISLAITPDGKSLLVAHHLPTPSANRDVICAGVSVIDVAAGTVCKKITLPNGSNLLRDIRVAPDGKTAAVVGSLARFQMPTTQLDRGWMNTSAVTLIDLAEMKPINTVLLDDVDRGGANPWGVMWSADGKALYVTHAGVHELSIIDVPGLREKLAKTASAPVTPNAYRTAVEDDLSYLVGLRQRVKLAGNGPRALAIVGDRVYVANYFTDTLDVVLLGPSPRVERSIALHEPKAMSPVRKGEMLFNDATLSFQGWQSCASCHSEDARVDGLSWDLLNDGIGNPKNSKSMLFAHKTPPAMSLGIRETAETAVRAGIRHILMTEQPEESALAIDEYLKQLQPAPSPLLENGKLSAAAQRGEKLFHDQNVGCAGCHHGEYFTDLAHHVVGTKGEYDRNDEAFDTPTLRECWRTAPYLHDGAAATMRDVLTTKNPKDQHGHTSQLTKEQLDDLIAYVLSL